MGSRISTSSKYTCGEFPSCIHSTYFFFISGLFSERKAVFFFFPFSVRAFSVLLSSIPLYLSPLNPSFPKARSWTGYVILQGCRYRNRDKEFSETKKKLPDFSGKELNWCFSAEAYQSFCVHTTTSTSTALIGKCLSIKPFL